MWRKVALIAVLAVGRSGISAFETGLDRRALEDALSIGQSRVDTIRSRFHQPYRLLVGVAPIDFVDVVTPFRKVVLAAETNAKAGGRQFGLKDAQQTLGDGTALALHVELTFHPFNTFIGVPGYTVALAAGPQVLSATSLDRIPRFGPRVEGVPVPATPSAGSLVLPPGSQPLTGGTLIARFSTTDLDPRGVYEMRVLDGTMVIGRAKIDFARLR